MTTRICKTSPNKFCYICGKYILSGDSVEITALIEERFFKYFGIKLGDQEKDFAPHVICRVCSTNLPFNVVSWKTEEIAIQYPYGMARVEESLDDCYFCAVNVRGFNRKNAHRINYPNLSSAIPMMKI